MVRTSHILCKLCEREGGFIIAPGPGGWFGDAPPGILSMHAGRGGASCVGVCVFYLQVDMEGVAARREDYWVLKLQ